MEYLLELEEKQRYRILGVGVIIATLFIMLSSMFLGMYGFILSTGLIFFILITPLLYGRYKLFLFLWLIVQPFLSIFEGKISHGDINPFTFFITGLSFPFALILFCKEIGIIIKKIPFIAYLIIFEIILSLNAIRPGTSLITNLQLIRFHFIEIFLISITYFYLKNNNSCETLFNWMNIFVITNSVVAVFQRLTGIGVVYIDGFSRVQGLVGHPNALGFLINTFLPVTFYMYCNADTKRKKIIWGISLVISIFALILSLSKTSYLIFGLLTFLIYLKSPHKLKIKSLLIAFVSIFIFLIIDASFNLNMIQTITMRFNDNSSLEWRYTVWNYLLANMNFHSYLFGHGTNSVTQYLSSVNPGNPATSHNGYLQLLYEYGITGLVYVIPFFYLFIKSVQNILFKKNILNNKLDNLIILGITFILIVETYMDQSLVNRSIMYFAWVLMTVFYMKVFLKEKTQYDNKE